MLLHLHAHACWTMYDSGWVAFGMGGSHVWRGGGAGTAFLSAVILVTNAICQVGARWHPCKVRQQ